MDNEEGVRDGRISLEDLVQCLPSIPLLEGPSPSPSPWEASGRVHVLLLSQLHHCNPNSSCPFTSVADTGAHQRGSLKEFVEKFKDRHYYVIEMRIVLVCSIGVFFKLFFSDVILEEEEGALTYSALTFVCCK